MKEQNPFSFYDFFGYLIPGFLSISILFFIQQLQNGLCLKKIIQDIHLELSLTQSIILIIISYFAGHILNFSSSITVEKYSYWKYDYPSKYLLRIQHVYPYFRGKFHIKIWRLIVAIILLPIVIGDFIFGELLNFKDIYVKALDEFLIASVKNKSQMLFSKLKLNLPQDRMREYDYHRIFSHYILQNSENVNGKTSNYIALYGYLRCMCLILSIGFWIAFFNLFISIWDYETSKQYFLNQSGLILFFISLFFLAYLTFMAFMKFYRRYSLENLMAIITTDF